MMQDTQTPQQPQWERGTPFATGVDETWSALKVYDTKGMRRTYDLPDWLIDRIFAQQRRIVALEAALRETASYEASLRRDLESLRMRFADSLSRHNAGKAALQERIELMEAANVSEELWESQRIEVLEGTLREAEAKAAGYKQSVEYALDRFGAIGSMSDWTDSDLSDATQEARDAAGTLKRNVRLLQQPRAGEIR